MDERTTQDGAGLVAWIDGLTLPTTRLREGYDMSGVDTFLAGVRDDAVRGAPVPPERVAQVRFTPTRRTVGYQMGTVDTALDELTRRLGSPRAREGARAVATPQDQAIVTCISHLRFTTTELGRRYDQAQVDRFLAGLRADL